MRKSEESLRALYSITAAQDLKFNEKVQALLVMGCQYFDMDTGILSQIKEESYRVQEVYTTTHNFQQGTVLPLSKTYCQETLRMEGPLSIEYARTTDWAAPSLLHPLSDRVLPGCAN